MKDDLKQIKKEFGDPRRTQFAEKDKAPAARILKQDQTTGREAVTLVVSTEGWVRLAKGHELKAEEFSYRDGDSLLGATEGYSDQYALFFDNSGRAYTLPAADLPSARGLGEPLSSRLDVADGVTIAGAALATAAENFLLASKTGHAFIANYGDMLAKGRKRGKLVMKIKNNAGLVPPLPIPHKEAEIAGTAGIAGNYVLCLSEKGRVLVADIQQIPKMKTGRGNTLIKLNKGDTLRQTLILQTGDAVRITENGESVLQWTKWTSRLSKPGNKGSVPSILKKRNLQRLHLSVNRQIG